MYASVSWVSIAPDNGLSPVRRQTITWTKADLRSVGPLGTNCWEIWIKMQHFRFTKMHLKTSSEKWRSFGPGEAELMRYGCLFKFRLEPNSSFDIGVLCSIVLCWTATYEFMWVHRNYHHLDDDKCLEPTVESIFKVHVYQLRRVEDCGTHSIQAKHKKW